MVVRWVRGGGCGGGGVSGESGVDVGAELGTEFVQNAV